MERDSKRTRRSTDDTETPTVEELREIFKEIPKKNQLEKFLADIKEKLKRNEAESSRTKDADKLSEWDLHIQSGVKILKFVNEHAGRIDAESGEGKQIIGSILKEIGNVHWAVAILSVIGYVVSKCAKMSENEKQCRELVQEMIPLLDKILELKHLIDEEKERFEEALVCVIEESIWCVQQLDPGTFRPLVRFLKSSVYSQRLSSIKSKIKSLQMEFILMVDIRQLKQWEVRGISPQGYPENAVGIDHQVTAVRELINMKITNGCPSWAVVMYGLGGVGKSTIAKAVASSVDRELYNFARIDLDSIAETTKSYTDLQQQILNYGFPTYKDGRKQQLSDAADGQYHIREAFKDVERNKPLFLFIDNVLNKKQLETILPEDLRNIPKGTKILITTRMLKETDVIKDRGLECKPYRVKILSDSHALEFLSKDLVAGRASVDIKGNVEQIISLCGGIPLVLKVVRGRLRRQGYNVDLCTQTIQNLKAGEEIKEDDLSDYLFKSVYKDLDGTTQEAFLDICCCFHEHWLLRHVKYIVGYEAVNFLEEAAFISKAMANQGEMLSVHSLIRRIGLLRSKSSRIIDDEHWSKAQNDEVTMNKIQSICVENKSCMLEERHFQWMENKLRILSWKGRINIPANGVRVPQMRCIKTDSDVDWMIVDAHDKLSFLECEKLPIELPESLKCVKVKRQPVEMEALSEIVPNCGLEEFSIEFKEGEGTSDESFDRAVYCKDAFNSFLQKLKKLKHLEIIKCPSLRQMPEEVCRSPQLITLCMKSCNQLESLTELFAELTALRKLCFDDCLSLKTLPPSFGHLESLTVLHLLGCQNLEALPLEFGQLSSLEKLFLHSCTNLKELPVTFGQLKSLKQLEIKWCASLKKLSDNFGELKHLTKLDLVWCTSLEELPSTFDKLRALRMLNISYCVSLSELPSTICNLSSLDRLNFSNCYLE